jgi:hypothetical protein
MRSEVTLVLDESKARGVHQCKRTWYKQGGLPVRALNLILFGMLIERSSLAEPLFTDEEIKINHH